MTDCKLQSEPHAAPNLRCDEYKKGLIEGQDEEGKYHPMKHKEQQRAEGLGPILIVVMRHRHNAFIHLQVYTHLVCFFLSSCRELLRRDTHHIVAEERVELEDTRDRPKGSGKGIQQPHVVVLIFVKGEPIQSGEDALKRRR